MPALRRPKQMLLLGSLLVLANLIVYGQAVRFDFINMDDLSYVPQNPAVREGLTASGIAWAFSGTRLGIYSPLTWLSHMLDVELFGMWAGGHHLTSVLIHVVTTILLFGLLVLFELGLFESFLLAALFSLHPLRVESVLWVAERKDVLSALFWMLTLWAYVLFTRRPASPARYAAVLIVYALGLLTKPMLVSLPLVVLLLDLWPLGRLRPGRKSLRTGDPEHGRTKAGWKAGWSDAGGAVGIRRGVEIPRSHGEPNLPARRVLLEKAPLFALAAVASLLAYIAQGAAGALAPSEVLPLGPRIANAVVAFPRYLWKIIWPVGLAVFYPYNLSIPAWQVAGSALFVIAATTLAVVYASRHPWLLTGWGWYVVALLPVAGIVQFSYHAIADRFTYLPSIGILLILAGLVETLIPKPGPARKKVGALGAAAACVLAVLAWRQGGYWKGSETLFSHAIDVTGSNFLNEQNLAEALYKQGRADEAVLHHARALELRNRLDDLASLGLTLFNGGKTAQAIDLYRRVLELDPEHFVARTNLGVALATQGKLDEATAEFERATRTNPDYAPALYNLALARESQNRAAEAIDLYRRTLAIDPANTDGHYNLALLLVRNERLEEAAGHLREVLKKRRDDARASQILGEIERRMKGRAASGPGRNAVPAGVPAAR